MKLAFGGVIAVILLGLYAYAVIYALLVATGAAAGPFNPGFATTMATVGGLVSALVIAELAITKPGEAPAGRALTDEKNPVPGAAASRNLKIVTSIYLLIWVALGLAAYVVGSMLHPEKLQPLSALGQSWLGLAVAAAYAYFGLSKP